MDITLLPPAPDPFNDSAEDFGNKASAFVAGQHAFVPEFNQKVSAFEASLNAFAAGGAYALVYTVDASSAAAGDPGTGNIRFNAAPQSAATALYLDTTSGGVDVSALLADFGASSSTVKGTIRLQQAGDLSRWMTFNVTAVAGSSGYYTLTVANRSSTAPGPFLDGVQVMLSFQRTGDKGDQGLSTIHAALLSF